MDITNADIPSAGGQISGDASRAAAIKRLQRLQQQGLLGVGSRSSAPNTGTTGLPKIGGGLQQEPGSSTYSPNPRKARRI